MFIFSNKKKKKKKKKKTLSSLFVCRVVTVSSL